MATNKGVKGYYQGHKELNDYVELYLTYKNNQSWVLQMTNKIPNYKEIINELDQLVIGTEIQTTVSKHNANWFKEKYFNGFSIIIK